jgi:hypothetical protein
MGCRFLIAEIYIPAIQGEGDWLSVTEDIFDGV